MRINTPIKSRSRQSGISMVEIMIAMLLGVILTSGVLQVFSASRQSYRMHEAISRMQESGRMAMEIISRDVRQADFWGCASDSVNVTNGLNSGGSGFVDYGSGGVAGTESAGNAPDILTIRGGVNAGLGVLPPYGPTTSADLTIAAGNGLAQDDIVFIGDCESADIFQVTNTDADTTGVIKHTTSGGSPGNANVANPGCPGANAHCLSKIYGADANVFTTTQITYNIATGAAGQPALFRNGLEFLDGVEDLQVLYGEDTDLDGTANYYVPANQVADMQSVISIRFAVVARSYDDNLTDGVAQTYNIFGNNVTAADNRLRQVYTSTVTMRNRL